MASRACAISTPRAIASPPSLLALPSTCGACTAWSQPESVRGDPNHPRSAHCRAAIRALVVAVPLTDRSSCPTTTAAPSRAKVSRMRRAWHVHVIQQPDLLTLSSVRANARTRVEGWATSARSPVLYPALASSAAMKVLALLVALACAALSPARAEEAAPTGPVFVAVAPL